MVLGFGLHEDDEPAVRLLGRLQFADAVVDTVHVVELPALLSLATTDSRLGAELTDTVQEEEEKSRRDGAAVAARLRAEGATPGSTSVLFGNGVAAQLDAYADRASAALIAVGSHGKGPALAFFTGSVGRGLVIGSHHSLLIVKGWQAETGRIRAVFATDHSEYADRCVDVLLDLAPQGISHLTVLTAYPLRAVRTIETFLPAGVGDPVEWVRKDLEQRNAHVIQRLAPLGCEMDSQVRDGAVTEAIPRVLQETGADLLILGAKEHGFLERLDEGSTSLHEAMTEAKSVLVLRAPGEPR